MNELEIFKKEVWPKIEFFYSEYGPATHDYSGYLGGEKQGWLGPYVWSENGDTVRIITRFCEEEFGIHSVHNESKVDGFRFKNFNPKKDNRKSIDIDITDARKYKPDDYMGFRKSKHGLFIEIKHIGKGCIWNDYTKKINGFIEDCKKIGEEKKKGRVRYCIAILIDDGDRGNKKKKTPPTPYLEKYIESNKYKDTKDFKDKIKKKHDVEPLILQWRDKEKQYKRV